MRILHFEYSDFFRKIVHDMTIQQGHDYIGSNSGADLYQLLGKYDVDIIFTGMELQDMSVESLLKEISASKYKNLPVVILTSSNVDNITRRLKQLQFSDFLLKENLSYETLSNCIKKYQ